MFVESWLDDRNHYHICCTVLAIIEQLPKNTAQIREVIEIRADDEIPDEFAWWSPNDLSKLFPKYWKT
jgi:hypothetical protein